MPLKDNHLKIAKSNEDFSRELLSEGKNLDWAVTVIFYSAIHYVEAYMATQDQHSGSHRMRDSEIGRDTNLRPLYDDFNDLKNDSIQCRYQGYTFPLNEINSRIQQSFDVVRSHILGLLHRNPSYPQA